MATPEGVLIGAGALAQHAAESLIADLDVLAAYEIGALNVPPEVGQRAESLLRRPARDYHSPDDVTLMGPDSDPR
jgi:hypothetical protein